MPGRIRIEPLTPICDDEACFFYRITFITPKRIRSDPIRGCITATTRCHHGLSVLHVSTLRFTAGPKLDSAGTVVSGTSRRRFESTGSAASPFLAAADNLNRARALPTIPRANREGPYA